MLGSNPESVGDWELGHRTPRACYIPKIITFLGYDPRPEPETFGERLRRAREGAGLTTAELGERLDMSQHPVWLAETGKPVGREKRQTLERFVEVYERKERLQPAPGTPSRPKSRPSEARN